MSCFVCGNDDAPHNVSVNMGNGQFQPVSLCDDHSSEWIRLRRRNSETPTRPEIHRPVWADPEETLSSLRRG